MRILGFALLCLLLWPTITAKADDDFAAEQQKAASTNPAGLTLTLRLPTGKPEFRQGEIIPLTLEFRSAQAGYQLNRFSLEEAHLDTVHVSPADGVADPLAEVRQQGYGFSGYIPPPVPLTATPHSLTLTLNEQVRFDRPGTYRLYVTSRRILADKARPSDSERGGQQITSDIVLITIIADDETWAHTQVQTALATLALSVYQTPEHIAALRILRFLGTKEAARALLGRLSSDEFPGESPSDAEDCRRGLIGFPDRRWLVGEMTRDIAEPDYAVSQTFLDTLTFIEIAPGEAASARAARFRSNWQLTADAVPQKKGRVRAMTLFTLVNSAWWDAEINTDASVQSRLPNLTRQLSEIFRDLPPLPQQYLLGEDWPRIRNAALLPTLRHLWDVSKPPENNDYALPDLLLRRIQDLSPTEGRALILQEIQSPHPRVKAEALSRLPDQTLPALDKFFASHLQDDNRVDDLDVTSQLVGRYATGAIFPQVKAAYEWGKDGWACDVQSGFLAYFLRVQPDYGIAQVETALARRKTTGCFHSVLTDVAARHYDPSLEAAAIQHLNDPDGEVVANAAQMLQEHGSPKAEAALMARLRSTDAPGPPREDYETWLVDALAKAQNWWIGRAKLSQLRALCQTPNARQWVDQYVASYGSSGVHMDYEAGEIDRWSIGPYNGTGWNAFAGKLAQFPPGTAFSWQDMSFGADEEKLFQRVQTFAQTRRMSVSRFHP